MKVKKSPEAIKKLVSEQSFHVKQNAGAVFIEGFANKATVDRGMDIIATDAWELDNYKANPVILYNHGYDVLGGTPVGKAVEVRSTDEGLYIKVRMSMSKAPEIQMIRDLVEEKILKAFSVGFDPKETEKVDIAGKSVNKITKAELFEVSIVGIPMNQDSLFELSEKVLRTKSLHEIKQEFLKCKKAKKALRIEEHFLNTMDRKEVIKTVAKDCKITIAEIMDMLVGDADLTEPVVKRFEEALGFKMEMEDEKPEDGEEEGKEKEESGAEKEEGAGEGEGGEEAAGEEEEDSSEASEKEGSLAKDFQECVSSKIPKLIDEGMDQDQAVAVAISRCQEDGKCTLPENSKIQVFAACFEALDNWDKESAFQLSFDEEKVKVEPVVESEESTEGKESSEDEDGDYVDSSEKQVGEESQADQAPTTPIKTESDPDDFGSPYLDAAKQTNVLLGALINEIQMLNSKIDGLSGSATVESEDNEVEESEEMPESSDDDEKSATVDYAKKRLENLDRRLKTLGY